MTHQVCLIIKNKNKEDYLVIKIKNKEDYLIIKNKNKEDYLTTIKIMKKNKIKVHSKNKDYLTTIKIMKKNKIIVHLKNKNNFPPINNHLFKAKDQIMNFKINQFQTI